MLWCFDFLHASAITNPVNGCFSQAKNEFHPLSKGYLTLLQINKTLYEAHFNFDENEGRRCKRKEFVIGEKISEKDEIFTLICFNESCDEAGDVEHSLTHQEKMKKNTLMGTIITNHLS